MNIAAIIAEYNPFHSGHAYQIEQTRQKGATHIIVIMSGNYVQRGEPAIAEKKIRTFCALKNGADLIIELPLTGALSGARGFADFGVALADSLNCVNMLSFGSECGDIEKLTKAATAVSDSAVTDEISRNSSSGRLYAALRHEAVKAVYSDDIASVLASPNDILAVEYVTALKHRKSKITPLAIPRIATEHDEATPRDNLASASYLRGLILNGDIDNIKPFMPESSFELLLSEIRLGAAPASILKLETAMLSALRQLSPESISQLPDISEGLENRIYSSIRKACSLEELYSLIKSKRYSHSRIRRIVMCAYLGISQPLAELPPQYIRVLGTNTRGKEILKEAKRTALLPIVTRYSDIKDIGRNAERVFELECRATDLYCLAKPQKSGCGSEQARKLIVI